MLTRGADIGYLGSTMPRSPSSSFGDGSVDLVYIPRRELLGVAGSCAVAAPISGDGLECFCLKSGVLGNEQPKQDHAVGLAVPIARRSCHLLLTAIFLACCLAAERRLPTHFTPFGGAFFQSTLFGSP
jgi:hypothetical protein